MPFRGKRISEEDAERIVEEHCDDVLAYCRRHAPSWDEAYDATQETFLLFIRSLPSYQDQGKLLAFLLTIARGVCIDACRRQSVPCEHLRDDIPSYQDGRASDLLTALGELSPGFATSFWTTVQLSIANPFCLLIKGGILLLQGFT